jgi:tetratricopeptide (TPR) repeat protein
MSQSSVNRQAASGLARLAGVGGCIRLGHVAGIPVLLHWSWFVVAWLELYLRASTYHSWAWNVVEFLSLFAIVLLHEFGHAFACRSVGGQVERIVLSPMGGVAALHPPPRPGPVLWSVAAGPLVNVLLLPVSAGALFAAYRAGWGHLYPDGTHYLLAVAVINALLLAFNLLPVYPLDGGQILYAVLWFVLGRPRSLAVVSFLGLVGSVVLCGACLGFGMWWGAAASLFLVFQAISGLGQARILHRPGWEHLGPAYLYLRQGQYERAVTESTLAVERLGRDDSAALAMAHQRLGVAHLGRGDTAQALVELSRAVELAPHAIFFFTRGQAHLSRGDYEAAVADFTTALSGDNQHALAHHQRGDAHFQMGQHELAWQDLARARQLDATLPEIYRKASDPDTAKRWLDLAVAACAVCVRVVPLAGAEPCHRAWELLQAGRHEEAVRACGEALRLNPKLAAAHLYRGDALRLLGRLDEALADAEQAVALDSSNASAFTLRGRLYRMRGEHERTIADCTEALGLDPANVIAYLERGLAHKKRGARGQAIDDYSEGIRLGPTSVPLRFCRAIAFAQQGQYADAIADYREAIRLDPADANSLNNLARLLSSCDDDQVRDGPEALRLARRACDLTGWKRANQLDTLATALAEVGDFELAVHWQREALNDPAFVAEHGADARARLRLYEERKPYRKS